MDGFTLTGLLVLAATILGRWGTGTAAETTGAIVTGKPVPIAPVVFLPKSWMMEKHRAWFRFVVSSFPGAEVM